MRPLLPPFTADEKVQAAEGARNKSDPAYLAAA